MTSTQFCNVHISTFAMALLTFPSFSVANASATSSVNWYPRHKTGLWVIKNEESQHAGHKTTELRCVGTLDEEKRTSKKEFLVENTDCRITVLKSSARKVAQRRICKKLDDVIATVSVIYQGDFARNYERKATLSLNIATRHEGAIQLKKYRFLGKCPKGTQPGDTFTTNAKGEIVGKWNRYTGLMKPLDLDVRDELRKQGAL